VKADEFTKRLRDFLKREGRLRERAVLKLRFKTKMLRIGAAFAATLGPSMPVLRLNAHYGKAILIPESSWRGSLRRISEWVARASANAVKDALERAILKAHYEPERGPLTHLRGADLPIEVEELIMVAEELARDGTLRRFLAPDEVDEVVAKAGELSRGRQLTRDQEERFRRILEPLVTPLCPICRLWGGPSLRGKVILEDTLLKPMTDIRTHVALNRAGGVREEARLYSAEVTLADVIELKAVVENALPGSTEALILAGTLEWLEEFGLGLGGFKSRGLGHLELEDCEVFLTELDNLRDLKLIRALIRPEEEGERMKLLDYLMHLRTS